MNKKENLVIRLSFSIKLAILVLVHFCTFYTLLLRGPKSKREGYRVRAYETMLVLKSDLEEATRDALIEKYEGVVAKEGGTVNPTTKLGKRRLAYEINNYRDG